MGASLLQEKIDKLQDIAGILLYSGENRGYIYTDDFSQLHKEIHGLINELYPCRGVTAEQEAALCLAILHGYSVSMYANPEDDEKKRDVLARVRIIMKTLPPSRSRERLLSIYKDAIRTFA